jgi:DNA-binding NarL/FixJ family response regulator
MTRRKSKSLEVFIVDDHVAVRKGLQALLDAFGMQVCGQAASPAEAKRSLEGLSCDVVVIDLGLGDAGGVALIRELAARRPGLGLLVYSMHEERWRVDEALRAGARGYVTKCDTAEHLAEAIAEVAAGKRYLSPRVISLLARDFIASAAGGGLDAPALSAQEHRVYGLLGQGYSVSEIAGELSLSSRTVQSYCSRIMTKLGLGHMRELRHRAVAEHRR